MPIQTAYSYTNDLLLPGMPVDVIDKVDLTAFSTSVIDFGVGVVYDGAATDTTSLKVKAPTASGGTFIGVSVYRHKQPSTSDKKAQYEAKEAVSIRTQGRIYVYAEEAVNPTLPVHLRFAGGTSGSFRASVDGSNTQAVSSAVWVSVTTGAGLAVLELNRP